MPENPTVQDMMAAYARDAVDLARNTFGETLDFSEGSVPAVERCLGRLHDALPKGFFGRLFRRGPSEDEMRMVTRTFGGYLGEVYRRHHGGDWILETPPMASEPFPTVATPSGIHFFPTAKAFKRIMNGPEDNVCFYYFVLTRYIGKDQGPSPGG